MSQSAIDQKFMARAIQLAKKGQYTTHPNPRVGCVIVKDEHIIGEGYHQVAGQAHAEINALQSVKDNKNNAKDATAYVTLEPCSHQGKTPPCAKALIDAGISRVVIGYQDPNPQVAGSGIRMLEEAGIDTEVGVLEEQAKQLNRGFNKRMQQGLPWVRIKLAMSLDGRTAMASGESQWITGEAARLDVQKLRASADAIMTGSGTVIKDNPSLNVRLSSAELAIKTDVQQPLRVIIDSTLKVPADSNMFSLEGDCLIYTQSKDKEKIKALENAGVQIQQNETDTDKLSLKSVLKNLAEQEINEVHVEAGSTLCGALLQQGLVDEIIVYMAPTIMGSAAQGLFELPGLDNMQDKINLQINDIRAIGEDYRISAQPLYN